MASDLSASVQYGFFKPEFDGKKLSGGFKVGSVDSGSLGFNIGRKHKDCKLTMDMSVDLPVIKHNFGFVTLEMHAIPSVGLDAKDPLHPEAKLKFAGKIYRKMSIAGDEQQRKTLMDELGWKSGLACNTHYVMNALKFPEKDEEFDKADVRFGVHIDADFDADLRSDGRNVEVKFTVAVELEIKKKLMQKKKEDDKDEDEEEENTEEDPAEEETSEENSIKWKDSEGNTKEVKIDGETTETRAEQMENAETQMAADEKMTQEEATQMLNEAKKAQQALKEEETILTSIEGEAEAGEAEVIAAEAADVAAEEAVAEATAEVAAETAAETGAVASEAADWFTIVGAVISGVAIAGIAASIVAAKEKLDKANEQKRKAEEAMSRAKIRANQSSAEEEHNQRLTKKKEILAQTEHKEAKLRKCLQSVKDARRKLHQVKEQYQWVDVGVAEGRSAPSWHHVRDIAAVGRVSRGEEAEGGYKIGDFCRGVAAIGRETRGGEIHGDYKFGDFSRGVRSIATGKGLGGIESAW